MNRLRLTVAILALSTVTATAALAAGDYTLYEPRPTASSRPPASPEDGLLVHNIVIKQGDTLWGLAAKYRGKGFYYPQFLILNKITNPDLIYAGKIIHVPVTPDHPVPARHRPRTRKERLSAAPVRHETAQTPAAVPLRHHKAPIAAAPVAKPAPHGVRNEETEQRLFEAASRAYKMGDCKEALPRFDRFLDRYPSSPLAADVALYQADCYMKLSGQ